MGLALQFGLELNWWWQQKEAETRRIWFCSWEEGSRGNVWYARVCTVEKWSMDFYPPNRDVLNSMLKCMCCYSNRMDWRVDWLHFWLQRLQTGAALTDTGHYKEPSPRLSRSLGLPAFIQALQRQGVRPAGGTNTHSRQSHRGRPVSSRELTLPKETLDPG